MAELTDVQLRDFEKQLTVRRDHLWGEVSAQLNGEGRERLRGVYGSVHDLGDESVAALLTDLGIATVNAEAEELADIERALNRIRNHTFGVCRDCGGDIAPDRLNAYPTARRCLACQQRYETNRGARDISPSL